MRYSSQNTRVAFVFMNNNYLQIGRGAGYVVGAILDAGFTLVFYDTSLKSISTVAMEIIQQNFDVLMISTMSQFFPEVLELIASIKTHKNIPVLVGGIHPTSVGPSILEQYPQIDFLCIGEGESMVVDFLNNFGNDSLMNIPNLTYRRNGQVISNPMRPPEDLAKLPLFPWNYFHREAEVASPFVMASRGCPYRCTFCGNDIFLQLYGKAYLRFRPISQVMDELEMLVREYSASSFYFLDEMMLSRHNYVFDLFTAIKKIFNIPYSLQGRVEYVDKDLVELFRDTGCTQFTMGVECGNEEFRKKYLNRRISNEQIRAAFSLLHEAGIQTVSNNIIGFPINQDRQLTKETIAFNLELRPTFANFNIFYPYPGTKLYYYCIEQDLIDQTKQKMYAHGQDSILKNVSLIETLHNIDLFLNTRHIPSF